jgi:hypothetical protein
MAGETMFPLPAPFFTFVHGSAAPGLPGEQVALRPPPFAHRIGTAYAARVVDQPSFGRRHWLLIMAVATWIAVGIATLAAIAYWAGLANSLPN